jgi:hypothetical protein
MSSCDVGYTSASAGGVTVYVASLSYSNGVANLRRTTMMNLLFHYWWLALPVVAIVGYYALRFCAKAQFDAGVQGIVRNAQAGFATGSVNIHAIEVCGVKRIDGEDVIVYDIDVTIVPSTAPHEWAASDLYVYGVDKDGNSDRMRIGEVSRVQRWNGESFESTKRTTIHNDTERLKLSIRFAGQPGPARFNYNFACFGPIFDLPRAETEAFA